MWQDFFLKSSFKFSLKYIALGELEATIEFLSASFCGGFSSQKAITLFLKHLTKNLVFPFLFLQSTFIYPSKSISSEIVSGISLLTSELESLHHESNSEVLAAVGHMPKMIMPQCSKYKGTHQIYKKQKRDLSRYSSLVNIFTVYKKKYIFFNIFF